MNVEQRHANAALASLVKTYDEIDRTDGAAGTSAACDPGTQLASIAA
jgi:hypothetical protein